MANINQISPDGGTTLYDIEDTEARTGVSTLNASVGLLDSRVGIAESRITNLQSVTNQLSNNKADISSLGTSAYKNSTSVVTDSSDLVESGAVYDALGFGNKNNLSIPTSVSTQSLNGIDYTFHRNSDGAVTKIDVVGTATSDSRFAWFIPDTFVQGETYKLTGWDVRNVTQGKTVNFAIIFNGVQGSRYILNVTDTELEYTCNKTGYTRIESAIFVQNGTTIDASIYPMIRKASVSDPTYEPYHASVEESLELKADNSVIGTVEEANASKAWSVGEHFIKDGQFKEVTQAIASSGAINDSNTVDRPIADCLVYKAGDKYMIASGIQIPLAGMCTNENVCFITIPINRKIVASAISLSSTSFNIKTIEGSVYSGNGSDLSILYDIGDNFIRLRLSKTGLFNANLVDTPIVIAMAAIITFS